MHPMKTKYIVWMHQNESVSTGTQPMSGSEARRLLRQEQAAIIQPNGCLPEWPRYEIRKSSFRPKERLE